MKAMCALGFYVQHGVRLLIAVLLCSCGPREGEGLRFYCAASQRLVMERVLALYEKEGGHVVHVQYGGSGAIRAQFTLAGADLFLPADVGYLKGLQVEDSERLALVELVPVILVEKGNPHEIRILEDLATPKLRLCIGDESTAIGKVSQSVLEAEGLVSSVLKQVVVERPTVTGVAETVELGAVDAAIVWCSTAEVLKDRCEIVAIPKASNVTSIATIAVVSENRSKQEEARRFLEFLHSDPRVRALYKEYGYSWLGEHR